LSFEDTSKALEEFGIAMRRPPFLEDKSRSGGTGGPVRR
jgi:hypothetical protein